MEICMKAIKPIQAPWRMSEVAMFEQFIDCALK